MTAISYGGETPTVGGDEDTWGSELNTALTEIKADLDMLNTASANSILGRNEGTAGEVERLTGTEVTAMLVAVVGDSGAGGTKGLVPAPASGDAAAGKVLLASGAWGAAGARGVFNAAGTAVKASGISCTKAGTGDFDFTLSPAMPDANYTIGVTLAVSGGYVATVSPTTQTTTAFSLAVFDGSGALADPAQIHVSVLP